MRAARFIPPLADPHARLLCLERIVTSTNPRDLCADDLRRVRQIARGLYDSLDDAMQAEFRRLLGASRKSHHEVRTTLR